MELTELYYLSMEELGDMETKIEFISYVLDMLNMDI